MNREYTDGTEPDVLPHWRGAAECHGPCQRGRAPCPCPQACEHEFANEFDGLELLGRGVVWVLAFVGLGAVVAYFGGCAT